MDSFSKKMSTHDSGYLRKLEFTCELREAAAGVTPEDLGMLANSCEDLSLDKQYYHYEDLDESEGFEGSRTSEYVPGKGLLVGKQKQKTGKYVPVYNPIHALIHGSDMITTNVSGYYLLKKTDKLGTDYLSIDLIALDTEITVPNAIFQAMINQKPHKCCKCRCIKHFSNELYRTSTEKEVIEKISSPTKCDCDCDYIYEDF